MNPIILRVILCLSCVLVLAGQAAQWPQVKATNIRRVFHNGEHNAFTDLIRWQGKFWLTFRSCPDGHMVHPTASIIILSSPDTHKWTQEHSFSVPQRDTRDPHFLVFKDKLFIYTGTWYCGDSSPARSEYTLNRHLGYAAWSADGKKWHSPVMLEGTFGHYIWKANTFNEKAYLCGRRNREFDIKARGEGATVQSAMLESDDGSSGERARYFRRCGVMKLRFNSDRKATSLLLVGAEGTRRNFSSRNLLISNGIAAKWTATLADRS